MTERPPPGYFKGETAKETCVSSSKSHGYELPDPRIVITLNQDEVQLSKTAINREVYSARLHFRILAIDSLSLFGEVHPCRDEQSFKNDPKTKKELK